MTAFGGRHRPHQDHGQPHRRLRRRRRADGRSSGSPWSWRSASSRPPGRHRARRMAARPRRAPSSTGSTRTVEHLRRARPAVRPTAELPGRSATRRGSPTHDRDCRPQLTLVGDQRRAAGAELRRALHLHRRARWASCCSGSGSCRPDGRDAGLVAQPRPHGRAAHRCVLLLARRADHRRPTPRATAGSATWRPARYVVAPQRRRPPAATSRATSAASRRHRHGQPAHRSPRPERLGADAPRPSTRSSRDLPADPRPASTRPPGTSPQHLRALRPGLAAAGSSGTTARQAWIPAQT